MEVLALMTGEPKNSVALVIPHTSVKHVSSIFVILQYVKMAGIVLWSPSMVYKRQNVIALITLLEIFANLESNEGINQWTLVKKN